MSKDWTGQTFIKPKRNDTYAFIDPSKHDLTGKRVFISGASKGIGRALAKSFAIAGASKIAIAARSDLSSHKKEIEEAARSAGRKDVPQVLSIQLDVTSWESMKSAAERTESEFGGLDILVNNAGYLNGYVKLADADPDEWWMNFEVNVKGVFLAEKAFIPILLKGGLKTIVNLSSIGAQLVGLGHGYQTTKHAVNRLTEHTAANYKDEGLLPFAVHPGGIPTELALGMPKEVHANLTDTPELAADTIVFLTSEKRDWLAGRYISSNWDMENFLKEKDRIVAEDLLKNKLHIG